MTDYTSEPVVISAERPMRATANGMKALAKATGHSMTELLQGTDDPDSEAERMQAVAFLELYKRASKLGHVPDAGTLWEQAGDVEIDVQTSEPSRMDDPLDGGS